MDGDGLRSKRLKGLKGLYKQIKKYAVTTNPDPSAFTNENTETSNQFSFY